MYIKREDARKLIRLIMDDKILKSDLHAYLDGLPSADAVEVVRCRECKWWREDGDHTCGLHFGASPLLAIDFCSRGERKDNE